MLSKMPLWLSRRSQPAPSQQEPARARAATTPTGKATSQARKPDKENEAAAVQEPGAAMLNLGLAGMAGCSRRRPKRRHNQF